MAFLMAAAALAAAAQAEPASKWQVDFGEAACLAARKYAIDGDDVTMIIKPAAHGLSTEFMLLKDGRSQPALAATATVWLDGEKIEAKRISYKSDELGQVVSRYTVPVNAARLASVSRLTFEDGRERTMIDVPRMGGVSDALGKCVSQLRETYNVAGEGLSEGPLGGADGAKGDVRSLITSDDYPASSVMSGKGGIARAFLLVNAEGRVKDCTLVSYAGDPLVLAQTCNILIERARFKPATDRDCVPTQGSFTTPIIRWMVQGKRRSAERAMVDEFEAMDRTYDAAFGGVDPEDYRTL
ncbi:hypothetical protein WJS89_11805 [Sphingomicrobium sp. XHP0235]|uniref:hypothetical protein n=1 Tax=Sphingomicrobium aquimarinum TaxID=3133971 RepID=UPI0031FE557A